MSLDRLLMDVDMAMVGIADNVQHLIKVLYIFIPVFIVTFALLVVLLVGLLVVSIFLQFKRLRADCRHRQRDASNERHALSGAELGEQHDGNGGKKKQISVPTYRRVSSDPRLSAAAGPTIAAPGPERRFPVPFSSASSTDQETEAETLPAGRKSYAEAVVTEQRKQPIPVSILSGTREERRVWLMGRHPAALEAAELAQQKQQQHGHGGHHHHEQQ